MAPVPTLCTYRPKAEKEAELLALLRRHWPTLHRLGLASDAPAKIWRARTRHDRPFFVELFEWREAGSSDVAHRTPEVMAVWEPIGACCDDMEFAELEPVE